jgi:hypothetical protein
MLPRMLPESSPGCSRGCSRGCFPGCSPGCSPGCVFCGPNLTCAPLRRNASFFQQGIFVAPGDAPRNAPGDAAGDAPGDAPRDAPLGCSRGCSRGCSEFHLRSSAAKCEFCPVRHLCCTGNRKQTSNSIQLSFEKLCFASQNVCFCYV